MGETMMAFEAMEAGPLRESVSFRKWIGGAEDNFAIGLARLGFRPGWFSRLGADEFGKQILNTIRGEGVDVSRVGLDREAQTGVFFVEPATEGDPKCYYYRQLSAATRLCPEDIDPDYVKSARLVYLTGITPAISDSACLAVEEVFRIAKSHGRQIIFDPNLRLKMWPIESARKVLIPLMQDSDFVLPGDLELKLLMEADTLAGAIERAHDMGIRNLAVKRGGTGAVLAVYGRPLVEVPCFEIKQPAGTMGAGDCFAAGFTAGLLEDRPLEECLRWGNAMGYFCLLGRGPYQALPDHDELMNFLEGRKNVSR